MNAKEFIFKALLDQYVDDWNMPCTGEKCLDDALAVPLNFVKPYNVSDADKLAYITSALVDRQTKTSLHVILVEATTIVSESPHCVQTSELSQT